MATLSTPAQTQHYVQEENYTTRKMMPWSSRVMNAIWYRTVAEGSSGLLHPARTRPVHFTSSSCPVLRTTLQAKVWPCCIMREEKH